tara:strand:+ start:102 stop:290 length:189 start_codon:yes stop_codon:yes gene_type:complete
MTNKINKKKKKIFKSYDKDEIKSISWYRVNDRGELVLSKAEMFEYDEFDQMMKKYSYDEKGV